MSYAPSDFYGVCGMMPAFATEDASSLTATSTVDVDNLQDGVDRAIKDGMHAIATTGTSGEVWNLLYEEWQTLVKATVEAVDKRVPLLLGCTVANPREAVQRMKFIRDVGGEGVLLGLPYYNPLPIKDIATFYRQIAELFPDLSIMIYHNPINHRVYIPVAAFKELTKIPSVVAMKDSHRSVEEMRKLQGIIKGKISQFVNQTQLWPYYELGAVGCWSINAWQGPWPILALYDAVSSGDNEKAQVILADIDGGGGDGWGQTAAAVVGFTGEGGGGGLGNRVHQRIGYIKAGAPRPPAAFGLPQTPEEEARADERAKKAADRWLALCEKYRPEVEARRAAK